MLRKLGDKYQSYCATYKTHTITTHHRRTGQTCEDRDINSHIDITTKEVTSGIDIGPDNNNESTNSLDTTLAFENCRWMATLAISCQATRPV